MQRMIHFRYCVYSLLGFKVKAHRLSKVIPRIVSFFFLNNDILKNQLMNSYVNKLYCPVYYCVLSVGWMGPWSLGLLISNFSLEIKYLSLPGTLNWENACSQVWQTFCNLESHAPRLLWQRGSLLYPPNSNCHTFRQILIFHT